MLITIAGCGALGGLLAAHMIGGGITGTGPSAGR